MTVIPTDNPSMTIWGEDAQERWLELAENGPAVRYAGAVMATSMQSVTTVLHHPEIFSSNPDAGFLGSDTGLIPLQIDPPDHVRYRRMLDPLFAPRRMAQLEGEVAALTNRCIDSFIDRGRCDFSTELALPLPSGTFLALLGLPLARLNEFIKAKDDMIRPEATSPEEADGIRATAGLWIVALFTEALDQRAEQPADDDILTHLARLEHTGELTREESLNICILQLMAGLDTVTCTLECSFAFLGRHPDHRRQLADDPSLVPSAVEELLRYETPVPMLARIALVDTDLHGFAVHAGEKVQVLLPSTNLDAGEFADATVVDFHRGANRHIAFGAGVHRCLGSHLARLELRTVLREWHRRIPEYHVPEGYQVLFSPALREIHHLDIEFPPGGTPAR